MPCRLFEGVDERSRGGVIEQQHDFARPPAVRLTIPVPDDAQIEAVVFGQPRLAASRFAS